LSDTIDCVKARSPITSLLSTPQNTLAYTTRLHGSKIISSEDCSVISNFSNENLNHETTAAVFSNDAKLLAFANEKVIYIADVLKKEIIKIIPTDKNKIQVLAFDETSNYIIAGNENGRVHQYNCVSSSALARLCSFPYNEADRSRIRKNYVSALAVNKNRLATTGYGGSVIIIDMFSRANKIAFNNSRSRINALHFVDNNTLISGNFDGLVTIFNIKEQKILKEIETPLIKIRQIISMPNPEYVMLCSNSNYVSILDIKRYKLIQHKFVSFKDTVIRLASLNEKSVAVALKDGSIEKIELSSGEDLKSLMLHNSLDKAYELVEKEPMLKSTPEYAELENTYKRIYQQAISALVNQNISLANELLNMFKGCTSKKKEIASLFISFRQYNNLKILYVGKKVTLAYALADRYPELKQTPIFKKLEELWRDDFKDAQRQMLQAKYGKANFILERYKTIPSKKELINLVLNQNKEFISFIIALDKKNYALASEMVTKNRLLKNVPSYNILQNELELKLEQIKGYIYKGELEKARKNIKTIENVAHLKKEVLAFSKECKHLELLQSHYNKNDFKSCYEVLDKYSHLYSTQLGEMLEKHWIGIIEKCEAYALKGASSDIKETLGDLATLEGRLDKIGDLFRLSFHIKIKLFLSKRSFTNAESFIYRYIDTFGKDHEIGELMKRYELKTKSKLAITYNLDINRHHWVKSEYFSSI
jgi:WD40 repeat protein